MSVLFDRGKIFFSVLCVVGHQAASHPDVVMHPSRISRGPINTVDHVDGASSSSSTTTVDLVASLKRRRREGAGVVSRRPREGHRQESFLHQKFSPGASFLQTERTAPEDNVPALEEERRKIAEDNLLATSAERSSSVRRRNDLLQSEIPPNDFARQRQNRRDGGPSAPIAINSPSTSFLSGETRSTGERLAGPPKATFAYFRDGRAIDLPHPLCDRLTNNMNAHPQAPLLQIYTRDILGAKFHGGGGSILDLLHFRLAALRHRLLGIKSVQESFGGNSASSSSSAASSSSSASSSSAASSSSSASSSSFMESSDSDSTFTKLFHGMKRDGISFLDADQAVAAGLLREMNSPHDPSRIHLPRPARQPVSARGPWEVYSRRRIGVDDGTSAPRSGADGRLLEVEARMSRSSLLEVDGGGSRRSGSSSGGLPVSLVHDLDLLPRSSGNVEDGEHSQTFLEQSDKKHHEERVNDGAHERSGYIHPHMVLFSHTAAHLSGPVLDFLRIWEPCVGRSFSQSLVTKNFGAGLGWALRTAVVRSRIGGGFSASMQERRVARRVRQVASLLLRSSEREKSAVGSWLRHGKSIVKTSGGTVKAPTRRFRATFALKKARLLIFRRKKSRAGSNMSGAEEEHIPVD